MTVSDDNSGTGATTGDTADADVFAAAVPTSPAAPVCTGRAPLITLCDTGAASPTAWVGREKFVRLGRGAGAGIEGIGRPAPGDNTTLGGGAALPTPGGEIVLLGGIPGTGARLTGKEDMAGSAPAGCIPGNDMGIVKGGNGGRFGIPARLGTPAKLGIVLPGNPTPPIGEEKFGIGVGAIGCPWLTPPSVLGITGIVGVPVLIDI